MTEPVLPPEILRHYQSVTEGQRLLEGAGRLEMARTREILERCLPQPPAIVLDVGGGPGAHAVWLAEAGYEVHLLDVVPLHVEQAIEASRRTAGRGICSARVGDARRLPYEDSFADAVLLLGPLYHLTDRADRVIALKEARRVVRPAGLVAAAVISRFASLLDGLSRGLLDDPRFEAMVRRDLEDGQHRNLTEDPGWFTTAFFHRPEEIRGELEEAGLAHEATFGIEGPGWLLRDFDVHWDNPARRRRLLDALGIIEAEPAILGVSAHILALGRKP